MTNKNNTQPHNSQPSLRDSLIPVAWLLGCVVLVIVVLGADRVFDLGKYVMLSAAVLSAAIARLGYRRRWRHIALGIRRSFVQLFPAFIVLFFIAMVSTMWMLSGVVPTLIDYGLQLLNPTYFLAAACAICSVVSVFTGSSWTTIATIGVALQGIGLVFGYSDGWIAGAIISGAYFGDKLSPLSDTTVLASSACGVPLLEHVRYMLHSTLPTITIALICYFVAGLALDVGGGIQSSEMVDALCQHFNLTPWTLLIPAITVGLIALRLSTHVTLGCSTLMGIAGLICWQPQLLAEMAGRMELGGGFVDSAGAIVKALCVGEEMHTGNPLFDELASTSGIAGMFSTMALIMCAMVFGGTMMGTGMLSTITGAIIRRVRGVRRVVAATVGTGLFFNACTADQYLSIILGSNVYKTLYARQHLEPRLLSRTLEDSISVTSVLFPWNSCGMTQSTVLGVATLTYLPYCIFNYLSPLMSLFLAYTGISIRRNERMKIMKE